MKKYLGLACVLLTVMITSCDFAIEEIDRQSKANFISLDTSKAKLIYGSGDELDTKNVRVFLHYSDNSVKELSESPLLRFSGFDKKDVCEHLPITVEYDGLPPAVYYVKKGIPELTEINIKNYPKKRYYIAESELEDLEKLKDGLVVEALYNGQENTIIEDYNLELIPGGENTFITVNISYQGKNASYTLYKYSSEPSIDVDFGEIKSDMKIGEDFDINQIKVSVNGQKLNTSMVHITPKSINEIDYNKLTDETFDIVVTINDTIGKKSVHLHGYTTTELFPDTVDKKFYKGQTLRLKNFNFEEKLSNGKRQKVFEWEKNVYFDDEQADVSKNGNEITLKKTGILNVKFKYKVPYQTELISGDCNIYVIEPHVKEIKAQWKPKTGIKGIPLEEDLTSTKYGTWTITPYDNLGNKLKTIEPQYCHFEYKDGIEKIREKLKSNQNEPVEETVEVFYWNIETDEPLKAPASVMFVLQ